jgi:hypothetical protein
MIHCWYDGNDQEFNADSMHFFLNCNQFVDIQEVLRIARR